MLLEGSFHTKMIYNINLQSPNYQNLINHLVIEESLGNSCCMEELKLEINFASLQVKLKKKSKQNQLCRATKLQMLKQKYQTGLKSAGLTDVTVL